MAIDWRRIEAIVGRKIYYVEPPLDCADELWCYPTAGVLGVWVAGEPVPVAAPGGGPVTARRCFYDVLRGLFVDVERRGDRLVVRRGVLNGAFHVATDAAEGLEALVARYLERGFREGSPWGFGLFGMASRQLRKDGVIACVGVAGCELRTSGGASWYQNARADPHATPEEAIAAAEQQLAAREAEGFVLRNFELLGPVEIEVSGADFVPSASPYEAVDRAVEALRALAREFPRGHFLVEELSPQRDTERLTAMGYGDFFVQMHAGRFDRWRSLPAPPHAGSSFAYFLARHGSLTWIVHPAIDHGLPMFYCGNLSGGGWSALELGEGLGEADMLADETPNHGYEDGLVFHGGWGRTGYFFDRRQASPTGEWAIYPLCLDGPQDEDPPGDDELPDASTIEAFGFWLERHVDELVATVRPRLQAIA